MFEDLKEQGRFICSRWNALFSGRQNMAKPVIGVMPLWDDEKDSIWMLPGYFADRRS